MSKHLKQWVAASWYNWSEMRGQNTDCEREPQINYNEWMNAKWCVNISEGAGLSKTASYFLLWKTDLLARISLTIMPTLTNIIR